MSTEPEHSLRVRGAVSDDGRENGKARLSGGEKEGRR